MVFGGLLSVFLQFKKKVINESILLGLRLISLVFSPTIHLYFLLINALLKTII